MAQWRNEEDQQTVSSDDQVYFVFNVFLPSSICIAYKSIN